MKLLLALLLANFPVLLSHAEAAPPDLGLPPGSQVRAVGETLEEAYARYRRSGSAGAAEAAGSAFASSRALDEVELTQVPVWPKLRDVLEAFRRVRDERFLQWKAMPGFGRRLSWLYPDDGCYARATLAIRQIQAWGFPKPLKVFAFGALSIRTANNPNGVANWWYHVAPIVSTHHELYVFDPSIEPTKPLLLRDWVARMSNDPSSIRIALCGAETYRPDDSCAPSGADPTAAALNDQQVFLQLEWQRLQGLGRDPAVELGAGPPWLR
jgi:hypothetical protein